MDVGIVTPELKKRTTFSVSRLARPDGSALALYTWPAPSLPIRAVIQISHGMVEHVGRYDRLAQALVKAGYAVYGSDHRGHGQTSVSPLEDGHFADHDGWRLLVEDQHLVNEHIARQHPGVPCVLFGHSFGSFVAQSYLFDYGHTLGGVVLSGTNSDIAKRVRLVRLIARAERRRLGAHGRSKLLLFLSFADYNKRFQPNRTEFDWLSRDPAEVDKYIADPRCGFEVTTQAWIDIMTGLITNDSESSRARIPKDLPIYIFSGARDPVGRFGVGPTALAAAYRRAGIASVTCKLYPDARHETLNETNRDEVTADLIAWLDTNVRRAAVTHSAVQHA